MLEDIYPRKRGGFSKEPLFGWWAKKKDILQLQFSRTVVLLDEYLDEINVAISK